MLFVIDDSGSMSDKQNALARAAPGFIAALQKKLVNAKSYHVGVTTSEDYLLMTTT